MVSHKPYRILYVDDEPGLLDIGKQFLEQTAGMVVETSLDALEAMDKLREGSFDAIVSDYQMPRMDGIEFLEAIRASGNDIPFIIFTGKGREDVVIKAFKSGADFYLQKGGNPRAQFAELVNMIRTSIEMKNSERKIQDSERKLRSIIDGLDQGMVVVGFDGRVLSFNRMAEEMTGVKEGDTIGDIKLLDPEAFKGIGSPGVEGMRKAMAASLRPAGDGLQRLRIRKQDGEYSWLEGHHSIIDFEGDPAVLILFRDITKWVEAEEARRAAEGRYSSMVDNNQEMVIRFAPDMKLTFANKALYDTMEVTEKGLLGKDVLSYLSEEEVQQFKGFSKTINPSNRNCRFRHIVIMDDDDRLEVEWDYHGIYDAEGNLIEYQAVGRVLSSTSSSETSD